MSTESIPHEVQAAIDRCRERSRESKVTEVSGEAVVRDSVELDVSNPTSTFTPEQVAELSRIHGVSCGECGAVGGCQHRHPKASGQFGTFDE